MDKNQKRINKMVRKSLDDIYRKSKLISKNFNAGMISITVLTLVIDKYKLKLKSGMPDDFVKNYNAVLDTLLATCINEATRSKTIYHKVLKHHISIIKKSFTDALRA